MAVIDRGIWTPAPPRPPLLPRWRIPLSMGISGKLRARLHGFQLTERLDASQRLPASQRICQLFALNSAATLSFWRPFRTISNRHKCFQALWVWRRVRFCMYVTSEVFSARSDDSVTGSSFHFSKNTSFTLDGDYHSQPPWRYNHKKIIVWPFFYGTPYHECAAYCFRRDCSGVIGLITSLAQTGYHFLQSHWVEGIILNVAVPAELKPRLLFLCCLAKSLFEVCGD